MFFCVFLAVCWACSWLFEHGHIHLAIACGLLFAIFWFVDRWFDQRDMQLGRKPDGCFTIKATDSATDDNAERTAK